MDKNILNKFLEKTYYKGQITKRFEVLKGYLQNKFFNSPQPPISPEDSDWLNSLGEDFSQQAGTSGSKNFTKLNIYQLLSKLEKNIKELRVLTVYLSFEMPDSEKDKLGSYLRANFKTDLIFEIKLDPNLIGGAAFSWKGIYKDYSLRSRIDQNHEQILSSLKSFSA